VFAIALTLLVIDLRIPVTTAITTSADLWLALEHPAGTNLCNAPRGAFRMKRSGSQR
jgi:hypothetical protein